MKLDNTPNYYSLRFIFSFFVILDHNDYLREGLGYYYDMLGFPVAIFLMLPFLFNDNKVTISYVRDRSTRFIIPYLFFYLITFVLWNFILNTTNLTVAIEKFILGLLFSNFHILKESTGLAGLWFLPTFLITLLAKNYILTQKGCYKRVLFCLVILAHLVVGIIPQSIVRYIPLGIVPAAHLIFLGLVARYVSLHIKTSKSLLIFVISLFTFIISYLVAIEAGYKLEIGAGLLPSYKEPLFLLLSDFIIISVFICSYSLFLLTPGFKFFQFLGKNSMSVYLLHPYIYYFILILFNGSISFSAGNLFEEWYIAFIVTLFLTILLTSITIVALNRVKIIKTLIFPISFNQWRSTCNSIIFLIKPR